MLDAMLQEKKVKNNLAITNDSDVILTSTRVDNSSRFRGLI